MRWLAAFVVLIAHLDARLFSPQTVFAARSLNDHLSMSGYYLWVFSMGFAHKAVIVFFVMSGWLVGGKVLREVLESGEVNLRRYFFDRLARLWIVLLPALILTYSLDLAGSTLVGGHDAYASLQSNLTPATLGCNALFLQMISCHELGSNVALWSLANEFWYYVLWPLLLAPFMNRKSSFTRWSLFSLGCVLAVALLSQRYGEYQVLPYFTIWVVGAGARVLTKSWSRTPQRAAAILILVLVAARIGDGTKLTSLAGWFLATDFCVALCLANLLLSIAQWKQPVTWLIQHPIHEFLAARSYSLYAIHVPIVMFLCAALQTGFGVGWHMSRYSIAAWLLLPCMAFATLLCAALFARMTELRTTDIKRGIAAIFSANRNAYRST